MTPTSQGERIHYAVSWDADPKQADAGQGSSTLHVTALDITTGSLLWQREPTKVSSLYQSSTQQVVDGVIYINSLSRQSSLVLAVDAKDGHLLWQHEDQQTCLSNMKICAGTVYLHVGPFYPREGNDGLQALLATNGKTLWTYMSSEYLSVDHTFVVTPKTVYIIVPEITRENRYEPGSKHQFVAALDASNGKLLWRKRYPRENEAFLLLVVANQAIYVVDQLARVDRHSLVDQVTSIQALQPESGKQIWTFKMPQNTGLFKVQVSDDILYLNGRSFFPNPKAPNSPQHNSLLLIALHAHDGKHLWQRQHEYDQITVLADQKLYGWASKSQTKKTFCSLDGATGKDLWCLDTLRPGLFSLSESGDTLLVVEDVQSSPWELSHNVYGLSKKEGKILWKQPWRSSDASVVTVTLVTVA